MNRWVAVNLADLLGAPARYEGEDEDSDDGSMDTENAGAAEEGEGQEAEQEEASTDPDKKKLSDEAAKHRVRAKAAEDKAEELQGQVRTLTLRLAVNAAATQLKITDTDAAMKLAADDLVAVELKDDGTVDTDRIGSIVAHVAERYPYLVSTPAPAVNTDKFPATGTSGRMMNGQRKPVDTLDERKLEAKFPALVRTRRR